MARNLLVYRYKHLERAIENATKLGFKDGAAFYPFVTMNGEECHNEWEITFEEIHRTSAMAYAMRDYIQYTGDEKYWSEYGLEVLIGIPTFKPTASAALFCSVHCIANVETTSGKMDSVNSKKDKTSLLTLPSL